MEIIENINVKLSSIKEEGIEYEDVFKRPDLIHGLVSYAGEVTDFCKVPYSVRNSIADFGTGAKNEMQNLYRSSAGTQLYLVTDSKRLILKAKLTRAFGYRKMTLWNSSGFDVYDVLDHNYIHRTVFAPPEGSYCFAESLLMKPNQPICIYLPNYNSIDNLLIGVEKGSYIKPYNLPGLPVIFYGNSVTQGAAASRSGNSFVNVVHRRLKRDVINLSISSCCRGQLDMARLIGTMNCSGIVIDYTRNAWSIDYFEKTYEDFYREVRKYHPEKKIILMTSACFNFWRDYGLFDIIVRKTYKAAVDRGENTFLLDQKALFSEHIYSIIAVDGSHYVDYGMFKVADAICKMLEE